GAGDQSSGVFGGEEIAAARRVSIMPVEDRDPIAGLCQKFFVGGRFMQRKCCTAEIGIVVDIGGMTGVPGAPAVQQTTIGSVHFREDEIESATLSVDPLRPLEYCPGIGDRRN